MGFLDNLFGSKQKVKPVSTLSAEQREIEKQVGPLIGQVLQRGATPLRGELFAEMDPLFNQAFAQLSRDALSAFGTTSDVLRTVATGGAEALVPFSQTARAFEESFATPMMETWRRTVLPVVESAFSAVPGGFFSTQRARDVEESANRFFSENIMPRYYDAYQAALGRAPLQVSAAQALGEVPFARFERIAGATDVERALRQAAITADQQEQLRLMAERNPGFALAMQYMGIPTMENVVTPAQQGQLFPMLAGGAGGAIAGGAGLLGKKIDALGGGLLGALSALG